MSKTLHQLVNEQKLETLRQSRSTSGKQRLNQLVTNQGSKTQWSGNIKELKNITKVVESILDSKDLDNEYIEILDRLDISDQKTLLDVRYEILKKLDNDPHYLRLFSKYSEIFGDMVKKSVLSKMKNKKDIVNFHN